VTQELSKLNPSLSLSVTFVPHLVPMSRGILSTCYAKLAAPEKGIEEVRRLYREFYRGEPFVRVVDAPPQTKQAWGSNLCLIYPAIDSRTGRLIVISCIDNLVKGGAGQAVQNMNVMLGMPEAAGLDAVGVYP
jgi:N-acetyl-gamma-glutamyl-phosphate reductase